MIQTIIKIQWNIENVFNSHYTSNNTSSSEIKTVELSEEILTLKKCIKKNKESDTQAVLQYIKKMN